MPDGEATDAMENPRLAHNSITIIAGITSDLVRSRQMPVTPSGDAN